MLKLKYFKTFKMHVRYVNINTYHISGQIVLSIWQFDEFFFNHQTANNISRGHCGCIFGNP